MKKLKSQSGRSMVEMLGVLAIIGVLSVGGIAGYSLSMRRHRANQVVDIASKYALTVFTHCQQKSLNGETGSLSAGRTGCSSAELSFEASGIGELPAGVEGFGHADLYDGSEHPFPEEVNVYIAFTDKKLCQAVASTVGVVRDYCNDKFPAVSFYVKNN